MLVHLMACNSLAMVFFEMNFAFTNVHNGGGCGFSRPTEHEIGMKAAIS